MFLYTGRPAGRQARETNGAGHREREGKKTRLDLHLNWWAKKASGGRDWELKTMTGIKVFLLQTQRQLTASPSTEFSPQPRFIPTDHWY